jgi:hypothetical protein
MDFGEVLRSLPGAQISVSLTRSSNFHSPSFQAAIYKSPSLLVRRSTLPLQTLGYSLLSLIRGIRVIRGLKIAPSALKEASRGERPHLSFRHA